MEANTPPFFFISYEYTGNQNAKNVAYALKERYGPNSVFFDNRESDLAELFSEQRIEVLSQARAIVLIDQFQSQAPSNATKTRLAEKSSQSRMLKDLSYFIKIEPSGVLNKAFAGKFVIDLDMRENDFESDKQSLEQFIGGKHIEFVEELNINSRATKGDSVEEMLIIRRVKSTTSSMEFYQELFKSIESVLKRGETISGLDPRISRHLLTSTIIDIQIAIENQPDSLNLSGEHMEKIPYGLQMLPHLKSLNLSRNGFSGSETLKDNMRHAGLTSIKGLDNNAELEILDVSGWKSLGGFQTLQKLIKLVELNASSTKFNDESVKNLASTPLKILDAVNSKSPQGKALGISTLRRLNLANSGVEGIASLNVNSNLEMLNLAGNDKLADISPLAKLKNSPLKEINLNSTSVTDISALAELPKLRRVDIGSTFVSSLEPLKEWIKKNEPYIATTSTSNLNNYDSWLVVSECRHLTEPPINLLSGGKAANVLDYFSDLENARAADIADFVNREARILIVGNATSGKSHIVQHLRTSAPASRKKAYKNIVSTHGMEVHKWTLPKKMSLKVGIEDAKVSILDFGGQDYYHHCHPIFFSERTCYLVVWEAATNRNAQLQTTVSEVPGVSRSEEMQHNTLEYWLEVISHYVRISSNHSWGLHTLIKNYYKRMENEDSMATINMESLFESSIEPRFNAAETGFKLLEDKLRELPVLQQLKPEQLDSIVSGLIRQAKHDLFQDTSVILVQNKIDRDGRKHLNMESITEEYPFVLESIAVSAIEGTGMNRLKNELIPEALVNLNLVGGKYPGYYQNVLEWMSGSKDYTVSIDAVQNKLTDAKPISDDRDDNVWEFLETAIHLGAAVLATNNLHDGDQHPPMETDSANEAKNDYLSATHPILNTLNNNDPKAEFYTSSVCNKGSNVIFVKPYEMVTDILKILSRDLRDRDGRFDREFVVQRLRLEVDDVDVDSILEIMKKFRIIFEDTRNQSASTKHMYIAPQYVNQKLPAGFGFTHVFLDKPIVRYQFKHMIHPSLLLEIFSLLKQSKELSSPRPDTESDTRFTFSRDMILVATTIPRSLGMLAVDREQYAINILSDKKYMRTELVNVLCHAVETASDQLTYRKEVTADGHCFVPIEKLNRYNQQQVHYFEHQGSLQQLGKYKDFIASREGNDMLLMKKLFISYSSKDKQLKEQLLVHLKVLERNNLVSTWHDGEILSGMDWDTTIKSELINADIVLLLLSPDFLNSEYIWTEEVQIALQLVKSDASDKLVIPIVLRSCGWLETSLSEIQAAGKVPRKGVPIVLADDLDQAWQSVIDDLTKLIRNQPLDV